MQTIALDKARNILSNISAKNNGNCQDKEMNI